MSARKTISVALAGNPNSGKTSLFNAITGAHQKTGNYAGVTVEKKEGHRSHKGYDIRLIDLPGTYSLTAYSLDEIVARDFLIKERPDLIVDVIDSTNLERNLFLCLQFQELGIPLVGALNMSDQAEGLGIFVDEKRLSEVLKLPFVKTVGSSGRGVEELLDVVIETAERLAEQAALVGGDLDGSEKAVPVAAVTGSASESKPGAASVSAPMSATASGAAAGSSFGAGRGAIPGNTSLIVSYGYEIEKEVGKIIGVLKRDADLRARYPIHWLGIKLIEKDREAARIVAESPAAAEIMRQAGESIAWIEKHYGMDAEIAVSEQRYGYIHGAVREAVKRRQIKRADVTESIDKVLLNRVLGLPLFLVILWAVFQITFTLGEYPMGWLESFFGWLSGAVSRVLPDGFLKGLIVDGIIGGVGGVFSFIPLIIILFLLISFLEDTGYMARAAFVTDRFLHIFGLHGQSFLPMMIGFGCSVPAIMAARTLKNPKDRITTILIIPFMSCGAKLPVYVLLAGAFFPRNPGNVVMSIYAAGIVLSLLAALFLRKVMMRGEASPFVMELPPYRMPTLKGILWHIGSKTAAYMKKAGTVILAAALIIWAITTFPRLPESEIARISAEAAAGDTDVTIATRSMEYSLAGRIGKVIEPVVRPLGFNWKVGVAALTGFAAKEVVVSTLGILYGTGTEETEESQSLREALAADAGFTPLSAYALMLFILILAPCFATLATIKAELGWKWLGFAFAYTTGLAWIISFLVFQAGKLFGG
jgi:ferrous iron transport protein B